MLLLYKNAEKRNDLGQNGLIWAKNFDSKTIWNGMDKIYKSKK
jgi:hypothetical protein